MENTKRQSNFELLRIAAMIMIILFHVQGHGPQPLLNEYFAFPTICKRLILFEIGTPLGAIGNGLFMMISGYFMSARTDIDTGKIAKKLLLQLGFATIVLMLAYALWITFFKNEALSSDTVTIADFNNNWWYIGYYMIVIVIAKLFFNKLISRLSQKQFCALLFTLLAITQFGWSGRLLSSLADGLRQLFIGIFFFGVGGYIARYNPFANVRLYTVFLILGAVYAVSFLSAYNIVSKAIDDYIKSDSDGNFIRSVQRYASYEITVVIFVICFFELFRRINIPYSRIINYIGSSTLMIYIIHENGFFQSFYSNDSWMEALIKSCPGYCAMWLKWTAAAFGTGLLAYIVYSILEKLLPKISILFIKKEAD